MKKVIIGVMGLAITFIAIFSTFAFMQGRISYNNNKNAHLNLEGIAETVADFRIEVGGHEYNLVESITDLVDVWTMNDIYFGYGAIREWTAKGGFNFNSDVGYNIVAILWAMWTLLLSVLGVIVSILIAPVIIVAMALSLFCYILLYGLQLILMFFAILNGAFIIFV